MSNITLYDDLKQQLSVMKFIHDVKNQTKISTLDVDTFEGQITVVMVRVANHLGIKESIPEITRNDILDLILEKYKSLSVDEIDYAFKMERHGNLGDRIQHFQLFNAEYIDNVLAKYIPWRNDKRKNHVVSEVKALPFVTTSKMEKDTQDALVDCFLIYKESNTIPSQRFYLYKWLFEKGLMPKDKPTIDATIKIAEENIKNKKVLSKDEHRKKKNLYNSVGLPKAILQSECRKISLERFFDNITTEEQLIKKLK